MALSRYYQPTNYEYMSQFVPKNLEIMDRGLQRAQAKQDKQVGKLDDLNSMILKQNALEGYDTEVRDQLVGEVKSFSDEMANTDLTNPENFRKVNQFVQSMSNDERIQKLNQGLALDKEGRDLYKKYQEDPEGFKYVSELDKFSPARQAYSQQSEDSKRMAADFLSGNTAWSAGVDTYKNRERYFDHINDAGWQNIASVGQGDLETFYKYGSTGVSENKILQTVASEFGDYLTSPGGRQEMIVMSKRNPNLSTENILQEMIQDFVGTGMKRAGMKSFTDKAGALNSAAKKSQDKISTTIEGVEQPGPLPLTGYKSSAHMLQEVNRLKNSGTPENILKARQLKASQEKFTAKAVENLTPSERKAVVVKYKDVTNPKELIDVISEASSYYGGLVRLAFSKLDKNDKNYEQNVKNIIKQQADFIGEDKLNKATKDVYAKKAGYSSYSGVQDKFDKEFQTGLGVEQTDMMPDIENQKVKTYLDTQAGSLINDINFEPTAIIEKKTGTAMDNPFGTLDNAALYADKTSFKIRKGIDGNKPAIVFSAKGPDSGNQFVEIVATPKSYTTAFENFLVNTVGENKAKQIKKEYFGANYSPIGSDELYSQTKDMGLDESKIGRVSLIPSGSKGVNIQQFGNQGEIPYKLSNREVAKEILDNVDPTIIPTLINTLSLDPNLFIRKNGVLTINYDIEDKPATFNSHIEARDFLSLKQNFNQ